MNEIYKEIALNVLIQAIEDYKLLKKHGFKRMLTEEKTYIYMDELEKFFNSKWCDYLLEYVSDLNGRDILRMLNKE